MNTAHSIEAPDTYGEAAKHAERLTDEQATDLIRKNDYVIVYPGPRRRATPAFVAFIDNEADWSIIYYRTPEQMDRPRNTAHWLTDYTATTADKAIVWVDSAQRLFWL